MKLRVLFGLLVLANLVFFVWTRGWLDGLTGVSAHGGREPERLARQFHPDAVRLLPSAQRAQATATTAAAAPACLEAGPFAGPDTAVAEGLLQAALPAGGWSRRELAQPGTWLVYLGRFSVKEALQGKASELRRVQMPYEEVTSPPELAPGLSVGRFDDRDAAERSLEDLSRRGVRGARVVTLAEPATLVALRVEPVTPALATRLAAIAGDVGGRPLGQAFAPCAR